MDLVITIAAYAITIILTFLGLTAILVGIGGLVGAVIVWFGISRIWIFLEGDVIPMAALIGSFVSLFFLDYKNLNDSAKYTAAAEQWGIVIVCIYIAVSTSPIRWI